MAIAGYLLLIDPKQFAKLNSELASQCPNMGGEPLLPTSSSRAFLSLDVLKTLRSNMSGDEVNKTLWKYGADWDTQVDEHMVTALLRTRDSNDLPPRGDLEQDPVQDPDSGDFLDWHLVETNIPAAWALLGGRNGIDWGDVTVGHIDTGFTRHPVLGFKKGAGDSPWIDTARDRNFFSKEVGMIGEGSSPASMFASWDNAEDTLGGFSGGHGTRTSSVLCGYDTGASAKRSAKAGLAYTGFFGVAPKVPVVPVRLEDSIWIQNELGAGLPDAIDYLVQSAGVSVITLSMGSPRTVFTGTGVPPRLKESLRNAYARGVIVVCAAGNHVPDEQVVFPARLAHTIAVGGSSPGGLPWSGSSYGVQVDISAPAYPIRRATTERSAKYLYGVGDGTSFATPHVAGTAALWLAHHKSAIASAYPARWQRVAAFLALLKTTARIPTDWSVNTRGAGILDAGALLAAPLPAASSLIEET
jgi:subtilisin family serine protease